MMETLARIFLWGVSGLVGLVWIWIAARLVTRAIYKTMNEQRSKDNVER